MSVLLASISIDDFSDDRISERLRALAEEEGSFGLTALDVSSHLRVSITLAQEFLKVSLLGEKIFLSRYQDTNAVIPFAFPFPSLPQTAEARCLLCRDESVQGVLFHPNRFPDYIKLIDKQ